MFPSRCRFCDHENPDGARFCNACGSPLHLKPCPQCESVNDATAEQCYECGASLDTGTPVETGASLEANQTSATVAAPIAAPSKTPEPQHVPEAFGARLDDLPPLTGHENVMAAERRDAFTRSRRVSAAAFALMVFLVIGALGYYGYQHRLGNEPDTGAESAQSEKGQQVERPQQTAAAPSESANAAATGAGGGESTNASSSTQPGALNTSAPNLATDAQSDAVTTAKPADASTSPASPSPPTAAAEANPQTPASTDAKQSADVKAAARSVTPRSPNKADSDPHSRPAAATSASAQATQRMIERYLGTRAGVSTQRSRQN